jgi:hypothetical protein
MSLSALGQNRPSARRRPNSGQTVSSSAVQNLVPPPTDEERDLPWGNVLQDPAPNSFRFGFLNHGGFPPFSCKVANRSIQACSCKNCSLRVFVSRHRFDALGLAECNLFWKKVAISDRLPERTRGWWESIHLSTASYEKYPAPTASQYGGVSLWSLNKAAHRVASSGQDLSGLGRWAWTRYRGCNGISLRCITAYRPVRNTAGAMSVWNQQRSYFDTKDDDRCPRDIFISDLLTEVTTWLESGDQLVLAMDANEDIRVGPLMAALAAVGLQEVIINRHGANGPPTFEQGSCPIDGLFVTPTLLGLQCGYTSYWHGHRCLWIDIPQSIAFGHEMPSIIRAPARRLKLDDPRIVSRFQDSYAAHITQEDLLARVQALNNEKQTPLTAAQAQEWEALDASRKQSILLSEKTCRKLKMGEVSWTPQYQLCHRKLEALNLLAKKRRGGKVSTRLVTRKLRSAGLSDLWTAPLDEINEDRDRYYRERKRIAQDSVQLRITWIESLAAAKAAAGNSSQEQEILNFNRREEQRRNARMIRRVNGKLRSGSVTSVIAPDAHGQWIECSTKTTIEKALLQENQRRFNQARDTPFLTSPLFEMIGPMGIGEHADAILAGTFVAPTGSDPYAVKLIAQLKRPPEVLAAPPMSVSLDSREYVKGWNKARERTSSGPSGLHFGHFKAGAAHTLIAEFDRLMAHIPYITGYSPQRWQHGTNVMLQKKVGNIRVDSLRAILLYEADFNHNNKKLGRDTMYTAEMLKVIAKEQYGSRKHKSAIDHCLNKRFTFDLSRQLRRAAALCSNDAKSCYDRIVHAIACLSLRRVGVPVEPIICMFTTIQRLHHYIRTIYGDSIQQFCGALWAVPIQGVGQGNGAGPQIWAVVSTPVLNMLRTEGYGAFFRTALSGESISFVGYAFVDDTDLIISPADTTATGNDVAARMQASLDLWEGGIRATGGAIVPAKSHWYLIDFIWKLGDWRYATEAETPSNLTVRDCDGRTQVLARLSVNVARRTLGAYLAPDGNDQTQFEVLRAAARTWKDQIRTGHLPRRLVWESMATTILKTLQYPLPATTLTRQQCDAIMVPILQGGLPASGIARTFPRAVVYAPICYQGLATQYKGCITFSEIFVIVRILTTLRGSFYGHHWSNSNSKWGSRDLFCLLPMLNTGFWQLPAG